MSVTRAVLRYKRGPMHDPRVLDIVIKIFENSCTRTGTGQLTVDIPALIEQKCGRYSKGKHKGQLRGWATWTYVERGGWVRNGPGYGNGHVVRPGHNIAVTVSDYTGNHYLEVNL